MVSLFTENIYEFLYYRTTAQTFRHEILLSQMKHLKEIVLGFAIIGKTGGLIKYITSR